MTACPSCASEIITPSGNKASRVLIVFSAPDGDSISTGKVLSGQKKYVLTHEWSKNVDYDINSCRFALLYYHEMRDSKKFDTCKQISWEDVLVPELAGKSHIILVGGVAVKQFTGESADNVGGMEVTELVGWDGMEDCNIELGAKFFALHDPNRVFKTHGEFRAAMKRLDSFLEGAKE